MEYASEQVEELFLEFDEKLNKAIDALMEEYQSMRAGRANPHILDKIQVDYYGTMSPLNQVGNISIPESRLIVITPWDASMVKPIEKAIFASNIGITPSSDGKVIRIAFPEITEERRKELAKKCKSTAEESKVTVRNVRRDAMDKLKKMKNDKELTEDDLEQYEKEVEKIIAKTIEKIDAKYKDKEKEVLSV